jgi:hypothetical protein
MTCPKNRAHRIKSEGLLSGPCAQPKSRPGPLACEAAHGIKEAGQGSKQERGSGRASDEVQALDIP